MRVIIAPDSFKGTIDAVAAGAALAAGWSERRPADVVQVLPMADGGEGTLDVIAHHRSDTLLCGAEVTGPDGRRVHASWLLMDDGTAVVEAATAIGLPLMRHPSPCDASSRGLGELMASAAAHPRVRRMLVALGGTATTDGGMGALVALGARVIGRSDEDLGHGPDALDGVARVDLRQLVPPPVEGVACLIDVSVPLLGPRGAAQQFGPQKGAGVADVRRLEGRLERWSRALGGDRDQPGAGAAGGLGYGLAVGWGAQLRPGAPILASLVGADRAFRDADVLVTGEGRFDDQSFQGKVVGHLLDEASAADVRTVVVAGRNDTTQTDVGVQVITLASLAGSVAAATREPARWLVEAGRVASSRAVETHATGDAGPGPSRPDVPAESTTSDYQPLGRRRPGRA